MKVKNLVTVIVAAFAFCLMFASSCEAAATTKATTKEKKAYTASDLRYLTSIIYCEARGESAAGRKAVGIVVMNRVKSKLYPDTVKEVIYQRNQFSPVRNGALDKALALYDQQKAEGKAKGDMKKCLKAAKSALKGSTTIKVWGKKKQMKGYLFFSRSLPNPQFKLGGHQFATRYR